MEFNEFSEKLREKIDDYVGGETVVKLQKVHKNNSVVLTGLCIVREDEQVVPNLYIDDYYREDLEEEDIECIARALLHSYISYGCEPGIDIDDYLIYEKARERFFFKLVNRGLNEDEIDEFVHKPYLDLEILVACRIDSKRGDMGSITVRRQHLKEWGVDEETVLNDAAKSFLNICPPLLISLNDYLRDMILSNEKIDTNDCEVMNQLDEMDNIEPVNRMYILSNTNICYGASMILSDEAVKKAFETIKSDFYIIPCSVHEVLIVSVNISEDVNGLKEMIHQVNETELTQMDILSDNLYMYDSNLNEIKIVS